MRQLVSQRRAAFLLALFLLCLLALPRLSQTLELALLPYLTLRFRLVLPGQQAQQVPRVRKARQARQVLQAQQARMGRQARPAPPD